MTMTTNTRKRLLRHKGRAGGDVEVFAKIPDEVLRSEAHATLPFPARAVLGAHAAQYRGNNNGSLSLTRATAREYGLSNPFTLDESNRELEARGLLLKTRDGTKPVGELRPLSALYALPWCRIDPPRPNDPHHATPTIYPPDTWRSWKALKLGLHWTVERRDRAPERKRQLQELEDKMRRKIEAESRELGSGRVLPVYPLGTKTGTHRVQKVARTDTQRVLESGPKRVPNGCPSEILGVGGQGKSAVAGGKTAGRPKPGAIASTAGADGPSSPPAEIPEDSSNGRRIGPPDPAPAASEIPLTSAPADLPVRASAVLPPSQEVVQRVRDRTGNAPKHYRDGEELRGWAFAVELTREGTELTKKKAGANLGRLRKRSVWSLVYLAALEAAKQGLYGHAAMQYMETRCLGDAMSIADAAAAAAPSPGFRSEIRDRAPSGSGTGP